MKINQNVFVIMLLGVILLLNVLVMRHEVPVYDEPHHYLYGTQILKLNSNKIDEGLMPFSALNVSLGVGRVFLINLFRPGAQVDPSSTLNTARFVTILFSLLLALYVFKWSKDLYGTSAGLFSLILYAFEPNIIAHSHFVTLDLYAACMTTVSSYYFWQFIKFGGWKRATVSALILGSSQLAKYSCVFLYPVFALIALIMYWGDLSKKLKLKDRAGLIRYLKSFFKFASFFVIVGIVIINIGFLFNRTFTPLGKYEFNSNTFKSLQYKFAALKNVPIPLAYPYIEGYDMHKWHEELGGKQHGFNYLLGKYRKGGGFKGYYFYTLLYKVPIATQIFVLFAIAAYIARHKKFSFSRDEAFFLVPIIFFTIYFNFFFTLHIGIRNFLLVLPLLYVFCGTLLKDWGTFTLKLKGLVVSLAAYLMISVLSYFPFYIPYFNELVWDRKQAYKILADSNIDWGQGGWYRDRYVAEHPGIYLNPKKPVVGRIIVSVNNLVGLYDAEQYKWLRENFEPVDQVAYSYLVYDVSQEQLKKTNYWKRRP